MEKSKKVVKSPNTKTGNLKSAFLRLYYGRTAKDMNFICIAGTTGTIEVANLVHEILKSSGQSVAMLASDQPLKIGSLYKFISTAWKTGANYVILTTEASSLKKGIFSGLPIHVAALTNSAPQDSESTESILLSMNPEYVVLNRDDANYLKFSEFAGTKGTLSYGKDRYANINIASSKLYKKGTEANLAIGNSHFTVASFMTGEPTVSYMAAATAIADALHITPEKIAEGIGNYDPDTTTTTA